MKRRWKILIALLLLVAFSGGWMWWNEPQVEPRLVGSWEEVPDRSTQFLPPIITFGEDGTYFRDNRVWLSFYVPPHETRMFWGVRGSRIICRTYTWRTPVQWLGQSRLSAWTSFLWKMATDPAERRAGSLYHAGGFQMEIVSVTKDQIVLQSINPDGTRRSETTYRRYTGHAGAGSPWY